jgi:hypothetical protein
MYLKNEKSYAGHIFRLTLLLAGCTALSLIWSNNGAVYSIGVAALIWCFILAQPYTQGIDVRGPMLVVTRYRWLYKTEFEYPLNELVLQHVKTLDARTSRLSMIKISAPGKEDFSVGSKDGFSEEQMQEFVNFVSTKKAELV